MRLTSKFVTSFRVWRALEETVVERRAKCHVSIKRLMVQRGKSAPCPEPLSRYRRRFVYDAMIVASALIGE